MTGKQNFATKNDIKRLGNDIRKLQDNIDGLEKRVIGNTKLIEDNRGEMAGFKGEMAGFKGEMAGFKGEMAGFKGEIAGFKREILSFKVEIDNKLQDHQERTEKMILQFKDEIVGHIDPVMKELVRMREEQVIMGHQLNQCEEKLEARERKAFI